MIPTTAAVLEPVNRGHRVALETVDVQARLRSLFSEVVVTQVYRNLEEANIEAVYTFPLPLDAVLLELTLELNGQTLQGVVQPQKVAEQRYEDAVEEGDTAVLLQQVEPGLFTFNVGNIAPGEKADIRLRYAQVHRWQGDRLRFHLPTTIAPRYGAPSASGLAPYAVPEHVLSADHGLSLKVSVAGTLAQADFECPSHPVAIASRAGVTEFSLFGGFTQMDRDFVLVVKEPANATPEGLCTKDGEEYVTLAAFHPTGPENESPAPRCLQLVVDCSGSMGGESIAQAKVALRQIIDLLRPNDFFNVIKFGSGYKELFAEPVVASEDNINMANKFVAQMDANMGGTEIGAALEVAFQVGRMEGLSSDILLITDGHVWGHEHLVDKAKQSGQRIFTVGVGNAVSEALVRSLAERTAGAAELVAPREDMAERIVRHVQRIDQPKASAVQVTWPGDAIRQVPETLETVYAGDTLHIYGWFEERPVGDAELTLTFDDGRTVTQKVSLSTEFAEQETLAAELPRVAAHARLPALDSKEAMDLAVHHQLVTEHTSFILVYDRDENEKATELPRLRTVPQVVPAGWGGDHLLENCAYFSDSVPASLAMKARTTGCIINSFRENRQYSSDMDAGAFDDMLEEARFNFEEVELQEELRKPGLTHRDFRRLKQGKFHCEDELYLRGYKVDVAVRELKQFIRQSIQSGYHCIKIIHGKGMHSPDGIARIKRECQEYLARNDFVLGYCPALHHDGGTGAMYVLLKKESSQQLSLSNDYR